MSGESRLGIAFSLVSSFVGALPVAAQAPGGVRGEVRNEANGKGVAEVVVRIEGTGQETRTGVSGGFAFARVRPGSYTIVVNALGFAAVEKVIDVMAGQATTIDIELTARPIELDEVLASADRSFSAASSRTVRAFDLAVRTVRSAQDLLQLAPGLVTAQHAGGGKAEQIFLRGFDADHGTDVAISVDGVPVNMVSHGHGQGYADLHFVIPHLIERIDVSKGPYNTRWGNFATAGAISFTTKDHLDGNMVRGEMGAFGTGTITALYQVPGSGPHQGAYLAGQFYRTDGPFDAPQDFGRFNLFGKFHTHLMEDTRLAVTASGFSSAWDASGQVPQRAVESGLIGRFGAIDDLEGGTTGRQDLNLRYESGTGTDRFVLQGYFTRYDFKLFSNFTLFLDNPEDGDMIEQTDRREVHGLNGSYRFEHPLGGLAQVAATLGGGYRADDIEVSLWQSPDRVRSRRLVDSGIRERNLYLRAEEELQISPGIRLQLGVRWDYFTYDVDDRLEGRPASLPHASGYAQQAILSPKASLVVSPSHALEFFFNTGSGFHSNDARAIVLDQRVADLVRAYRRDGVGEVAIEDSLVARNLDPAHIDVETLPRATGAELGLRLRPFNALNIAAAAWVLDLEREFVFVGDGGFTELSGRSRRYGLDVEARAGFTAWLSADADISLSRGILRDEPDEANQIPLAPRITWTGGINAIRPDHWDASLRYVHVGDRSANEDKSVTAEGYTVFNLLGSYRFGPARLSITVENLFDTEWNEAQFDTESRLPGEAVPVSELHFTPGAPRNVRIGLSYWF